MKDGGRTGGKQTLQDDVPQITAARTQREQRGQKKMRK